MSEFIYIIHYAFAAAFAFGTVAMAAAGIFASCMVLYSIGGAIVEAVGGRK